MTSVPGVGARILDSAALDEIAVRVELDPLDGVWLPNPVPPGGKRIVCA
jgi:hypothetical protein